MTRKLLATRNYARGAELERRVVAYFHDRGFPLARRVAGSKGLVDVIAVRTGQLVIVQCKGGGAALSNGEWNLLWSLGHELGAVPILASTDQRGRMVLWKLTGPRPVRSRSWPAESWEAEPVELQTLTPGEREAWEGEWT